MKENRMKTIGLIGGLSWESTAEYYRIINETVGDRLGGLHSARIMMVSVDFAEIEVMQMEGRWGEAGEALSQAARQLESAGAACVLICSNTMHRVADAVVAATDLHFIHIADATATRIPLATIPMLERRQHEREPGVFKTCIGMNPTRTVGLLGTAFTMEQSFYRERLEKWGHTVLVPGAGDRAIVHRIIYDELCLGMVRKESRAEYERIMRGLVDRGADGIILGCTEIEFLVDPDDDSIAPLLPTTRIHAEAAVEWALR
jgi:aspartate racemase